MRMILPAAAIAAALALAACASDGARTSSFGAYSQELAELRAACDARSGFLVPVPGALTGRPATDYVCDVKSLGSPRVQAPRDASTN